jgi:GT2 family glycosyltransferase
VDGEVIPELSVVVMGYRDEDTIVRATASVLDQSSGRAVEVVAVISGGDHSADRLRAAFRDLKIVDVPERMLPGAARNAGVAVTSGEVVAFLAADCVARPGWVDARLAAHRAGHDAVATPVDLDGPPRPVPLAGHLLLFATRLPGRPAGPVPAAIAHGLSIRRSRLAEVGPYDEDLRIGEDSVLATRLATAGVPLWFEPRAVTAHAAPTTISAFLRDQYGRGVRRAPHAPAGSRGLLRPSARQTRDRLRVVAHDGWRHRAWAGRRVLAAWPAVLAGALANQAGWVSGRRAQRRGDAPTG